MIKLRDLLNIVNNKTTVNINYYSGIEIREVTLKADESIHMLTDNILNKEVSDINMTPDAIVIWLRDED